jgi:hypothetical protein
MFIAFTASNGSLHFFPTINDIPRVSLNPRIWACFPNSEILHAQGKDSKEAIVQLLVFSPRILLH